jgi:hypothetical protein
MTKIVKNKPKIPSKAILTLININTELPETSDPIDEENREKDELLSQLVSVNIKQLNLDEESEKSIEKQQQQDKTKFIQKEKKK